MFSFLLLSFVTTVTAVSVAYFFFQAYMSPLGKIPGPFLAKFTELWRLMSSRRRRTEREQRDLHDRYGPVVRLGPRMVTISDPAMIPIVYSRKQVLIKGQFYWPQDMNVNGHRTESHFSTRDEQMNTQFIRPVQKLYSMGHMVQLEPLIDSTIESFTSHLTERYVKAEKPCDIDQWLHYFAWDVISDASFSERLGFMEQGKDVENTLASNFAFADYTAVVGMMPWLDYLFERNPLKSYKSSTFAPAITFALEKIGQRLSGKDGHESNSTQDMLDGFIKAHKDNPAEAKQEALLSYVYGNVVAGSDTVAGELRSIVYHLCKNPTALSKLQKELDEAQVSTPVSWAQCQALPYLCATVSEGFRIMPSVIFPLERVVGSEGMAVPLADGTDCFLPPGTLVGMNPYVVNRDKGVFGSDAEHFRPERWLQSKEETPGQFQTHLKAMQASDITFGAGKRGCLGRNLALIECHKIIATLFRVFDVELVDPEKEWKTHSAWMIRQTDMDVKLKRRF